MQEDPESDEEEEGAEEMTSRRRNIKQEGLDNEPDVDEIKEEMKVTHQISVKQVYKMKNTRRPLYLVITGKEIVLKFLQKTVNVLSYTKVPNMGHATTNCNAKPVCLKCAKGHLTSECPLKKEEIAKCANCGGIIPPITLSAQCT
ncbi:hypothetical protein HHI36_003544 [Cryptolaemus montrouzieri]